MNIVTDYSALYAANEKAFAAAAQQTLRDATAFAREHTQTGEYVSSLQLGAINRTGNGLTVRIGSPLPQARAVELGADVGPRRGPHMKGQGSIGKAVEQFPRQMGHQSQSEWEANYNVGSGKGWSGHERRMTSPAFGTTGVGSEEGEFGANA